MIGSTLSHYKITGELGRGGMGIVYKGEDTKLKRTVAIKVLPVAALSNEDDRARFYREARSAASLSHPNIAIIHQIDEAVPSDALHGTEPSPFIAMEFIEGDKLEDRIKKGPFALEEAVRIASEVADGLKAAHAKNIVHRDIKAANIMLDANGRSKILDFGLAQTAQSTKLTRMGSTLGTIAYMSPEQARGDEVDNRTDIWALGVVLYEMVSGTHPFGGDYEQAVVYSIMNEEVKPLTALRTGVPMGFEWIVTKMLAKKADERYQSCDDLMVDLKTVDLGSADRGRSASSGASGSSQSAGRKMEMTLPDWRNWKTSLPVAVLLLSVGVWLGQQMFGTTPPSIPPSQQFQLAVEDLQSAIYLDVSRDGKYLVFSGQDSTAGYSVYVYDIETGEKRLLNRNRGDRYQFSPDNSKLVFRDGTNIFTIPNFGGVATEIGPFGSGWPVFSYDGSIVIDQNESLWMYSADGTDHDKISRVDSASGEGGHYNAWPLPDNRHFLFQITRTTGEGRQLSLLDINTGRHILLGPGASPRYIDSGHILYVDGSSSAAGQVLLRPFDANALNWSGPPIAMAEVGAASDYTIDKFGTMYSKQFNAAGVLSLGDNFVVLDPTTGAENQLTLRGKYYNHRVSPDGRQISYSTDIDENGVGEYISVFDRQTGNERQLTPSGAANFSAWSADGESLYLEFNSKLERWSNASLLRVETIETEGLVSFFDVSPDENLIVYINHDNQGFGNLHMLDRGSGEDRIILSGSYRDPRFSPDGKFIAVSDGNPIRVVVYSVEDETTTVATNASELAYEALWGPDSALYYHADPNLLVRLPVSLDGSFRPTGRSSLVNAFNSDFSMDFMSSGSVVIHERSAASRPFTLSARSESFKIDVTTNWFEVAKRIAPASQ